MAFGDVIDSVLEPFAPARVRKRIAQRLALKQMRLYDAAGTNRRTQGWRRTSTSANKETGASLGKLRDGARELVRNNKYAAATRRQIVANLWGDGIEARAVHPVDAVASKAQQAWEAWSNSRVDGRNDWYGVGKLAVSAMVEGGESLILWSNDASGPNGRCRAVEGDYIDSTQSDYTTGGRLVQGIQFAPNGDRAGYWLYTSDPGDGSGFAKSALNNAADVDHIYEELRAGQVRGVPWLAPMMMTFLDLRDYEDALLMKRKVEACLALVLTQQDDQIDAADKNSPYQGIDGIETLRPGAILRAKTGQQATVVNPSSGGDGIEFIRQQLAAISANTAPYHLITGDVSQANYSSLRAALLGFWANLDDWQQNVLIPQLCKPAFDRRMRRLTLETGDKRFLDVTAAWAPPPRRFVDPLKDVLGEVAENRAGYKTLSQSLSERGRNYREHLQEIATVNALIDSLKLALETDPRRLTDNGMLQAAAGYLGTGGGSKTTEPATPAD